MPRTFLWTLAAVTVAFLAASAWLHSWPMARAEESAPAPAASNSTTAAAPATTADPPHKSGQGKAPSTGTGRAPYRVSPMFRDLTDADIADVLAFVGEILPWLKDDMEKMRTAEPDRFCQTCRHLRFEIAQLRRMKEQDPAGFRMAIEEKRLRYQAQDLATKARAAQMCLEYSDLMKELRKVVQRLFDVEIATREAQIKQLDNRLERLRQELKDRNSSRDKIIQDRIDELLSGKAAPAKGSPTATSAASTVP